MQGLYDIIIVGAGPAGLAAAIYARRAGKSVLIIEKNGFGGQMTYSPRIENYPGFTAISGAELADKMTEQALELGAETEFAEVISVSVETDGIKDGINDGETEGAIKTVICDSGEYRCRALIIAVGAKHRLLGVPGEEEHMGSGVSFCAVCDGAFYRDAHVAVVGGGNSALQEALLLADSSRRVTIVQNLNFLTGEKTLADAVAARDNIDIIYGASVLSVDGEGGELTGLTLLTEGNAEPVTLRCDGIFVAIGLAPDCGAYSRLAELDGAGYIKSGESCLTKTPGVFAAGDCRSKSVRQITTAVSDGAAAALAACKYLS